MIYNGTLNEISQDTIPLNDYKTVCGSCTLYIVSFAVTSTVISTVFIYFYWYSKKYYQCLLLI